MSNVLIRLLIILMFLLIAVPAWAANHFIRAGATGTAGGTDWTNACTDFTGSCAVASLVRGDTYYVATGTYGSRVFDTAESGALVISILRATTTAHGTDTGWSNAFDGQVTWSFDTPSKTNLTFKTGYWTFDGMTGSGFGVSGYGYLMALPGTCSGLSGKTINVNIGVAGGVLSTVTVQHVGMQGCGSGFNLNTDAFGLGCGTCYVTNLTLANNYSTNNNGMFDITNVSNSTVEHNIGENFAVFPGIHAEVMAVTSFSAGGQCAANVCSTNDTFRYNIIKGCRSSGCIQMILSGGDPISMDNWKIYGNVFVDDASGDGVITPGGPAGQRGTIVYNNTCINCAKFFFSSCGDATSCALSTGNVVKNNLLYNSQSVITNKDVVNGSGAQGAALDEDYNTFWAPTDVGQTETNGQIVLGGACPLVNCAIGSAGDYHLLVDSVANCTSTTATCAGLSLATPYNTDLDGRARSGDGTWERGAYEFGSGGGSPPGDTIIFFSKSGMTHVR